MNIIIKSTPKDEIEVGIPNFLCNHMVIQSVPPVDPPPLNENATPAPINIPPNIPARIITEVGS